MVDLQDIKYSSLLYSRSLLFISFMLSNRDGYLLELTGWTQGSQAS